MPTIAASRTRLLFVYSADSGIGAALRDAVHKIVSPGTYACSLCAATHGPLTMHRQWRDWLRAAPFDARFMYRDELARAYAGIDVPLPAVLVEGVGLPQSLLGPEALDTLSNVEALISRIETALSEAEIKPWMRER